MNAPGLRAALAAACDLVDGVWIARGREEVAYADGGEAHVARVVAEAADIATGSAELARAIRDWPSQYHLAAARANLLRPLALSREKSVLEIGAGCGALTRYLGEACGTVLALEGNLARARIAASRCRDLDNVTVVCADFPAFAAPGDFDLVTLVGVLEYSPVYIEAQDPVQAVLAAARERVRMGDLRGEGGRRRESGHLIVAIENQLGLKYLAGAPEDHLGRPYVGVTGAYGEGTPVTFGLHELRARLAVAGFDDVEVLYPFPDYKLPVAILTDAGFERHGFNAGDLIATAYAYRYDAPGERAYSESLARDTFIRNGMGAHTANSFLAIAGPRQPRDAIAYAFTVGRDRSYASEARFVPGARGLGVERRPLYEGATTGEVEHIRAPLERYVEGEVLYRGLERLLARPGWSAGTIAQWATQWVEFLAGHARADVERGAELALPAALFDCTPFNVARKSDGSLASFDLEWPAPGGETITLAHAVFRGLYNALLRVEFVAAPEGETPIDVATLAHAVLGELGYDVPSAKVDEWVGADYAFTSRIAGIPRAAAMPDPTRLRIAATPPVEFTADELAPVGRLRASEAELGRTMGRARELESILARPHHRLASWFGDLIEPFPRLRAAARSPFDALARGGRPPIAAIVHLHYDELWPELAAALRNAPFDEVYVSIRADAPGALEAAIAHDFPKARVRRVANRGRDVWPFVEALAAARRDGMELVCKIHGKRSPHLPGGEAWRRDMVEKLLGSPEIAQRIVADFREDPALGMVGPGGHIVPSSYYWTRNEARVRELAERMGLDAAGLQFGYVAGSMFWARVAALAPILGLGLRSTDFSPEPAPGDGELAHALERCFALAAMKAGFALRESANASGSTVRDFAP